MKANARNVIDNFQPQLENVGTQNSNVVEFKRKADQERTVGDPAYFAETDTFDLLDEDWNAVFGRGGFIIE